MKDTNILIAIDPGTDKSGVAIFVNGHLHNLEMMTLPKLSEFIKLTYGQYVVEDVEAIKTIYARNRKTNTGSGLQTAQSVGQVKATGRHIIEFIKWWGMPVETLKPISGNWGTMSTDAGKRALTQRTGWTGSSNKDTRSAAYFGWRYLQQQANTAKRFA